jgi:hypothetical protein
MNGQISSQGSITGSETFNGGMNGQIAAQGNIAGAMSFNGGMSGSINVQGNITGSETYNGGMSGQIVSRGNIAGAVTFNGGFSGLVAAQGDIGSILRKADGSAVVGTDKANSLTRFGGITINGGMNGQIVALCNIFGDIIINGGLNGRIAAKGQKVLGLDQQRYGILGNVVINGGIGSSGAIVSGGMIGDNGGSGNNAYGTHLTINGTDSGILAAEGNINFGQTGTLNTKGLFVNATGANKAAIDAIFTQGGTPLTFDVVINGKTGLALILADLTALKVGSNGNLTGPVA